MHSESSGNINYWPGFVDAFSNLVLALVFVIVILAMSLGMFSGLMAKMAIQRALVEQQRGGESGGTPLVAPRGADASDAVGGGNAQASQPARQVSGPAGDDLPPEQAEGKDGDAAGMQAAIHVEPASSVDAGPVSGGEAAGVAQEVAPRRQDVTAAAAAASPVTNAQEHALRRENDALRQELAALRNKKQAELAQGAVAVSGSGGGGNAAGSSETEGRHAKSADKFGPMMPQDNHSFRQRIEDDLQRTLKEFEARRASGASIEVVIYVPNYALTENKRTALFYLISIKDYLMKRKVAPGQIRMHMAPASAGQKDMTVSMSVEP